MTALSGMRNEEWGMEWNGEWGFMRVYITLLFVELDGYVIFDFHL
jgi:hypothetical protein